MYKKGVRRGECGRIREREVSWRDEAEVSEEEEGSRRGYGRRGWGGGDLRKGGQGRLTRKSSQSRA